jgi:very-short-patch-repair endonuclease
MKKYPVNGAYARVRALAASDDRGERHIWQFLRLKAQVPTPSALGRYVADFVCHEARLVVEHGGQHDCSSCGEAERTEFCKTRLSDSAVLEQQWGFD